MRGRLLRVSVVAALATAVFAVLLVLRTPNQNLPAKAKAAAAPTNLGAAPRPAFAPGQPELLRHDTAASWWATVMQPVTAVRAPGGAAPVAALGTLTPEQTTNLVLVLGSVRRHGREWVRIRLPVLPNNTTAWVPRSALGGYHFVTTHLVVDLRALRATLFRDGHAVFSAPVGIGQPQWPTPRGEFYIRDKLTGYASAFYGPVAFGTSARSAVLTDWPDGGFVGIHGTDAPGLIPGRVSHGCIRFRNRDILRLAKLMPVGTPLTID
jgi:lipoprotein-anchoring transpeptidase ErfK/SrfK